MARHELKGTPVFSGVGIGTVCVVVEAGARRIPTRKIPQSEVARALASFEAARKRAIDGLHVIQSATARELGIQDAAIYGAQAAVLHDPDAVKSIRELVREQRFAPESAIQELLDKFAGLFEKLEGGDIKSWAADLRDPWHAVLRELSQEQQTVDPAEGCDDQLVVVAEELTPSLVTRFERTRIAALLCARGGRFSHGAVLARSFGIPTLIGLDKVHGRSRNGEPAVVYAGAGRALIGAEQLEVDEGRKLAAEHDHVAHVLVKAAEEPGRTKDGTAIRVLANIESPRDLELFDTHTVAGVGLFRTEFAYMERPNFPSAQEQAAVYRSILKQFPGKPVVFRTLDIGGDKTLRYFQTPEEHNPAMGWRGLRISLEWQDLFLLQLSALFDASDAGDARVLLPMVTTLEELREARGLVDRLQGDDPGQRLPLGMMVEVPAAALAIRDFLDEVDFVSVGTNDLAQYLFAVDRDNAWVSNLYQPYHPAHLRLLLDIAEASAEAGKPFSVCGEMAGEPAGALFLVGAGYRDLSVAPPAVPIVKALLREVPLTQLQSLARDAAACKTGPESRKLLEQAADSYWKGIVEGVAQAPAPGQER